MHDPDHDERSSAPLREGADAGTLRLIDELDRAYTIGAPPSAPRLDAVILGALRQRTATRQRFGITILPRRARSHVSWSARIGWRIALLGAVLSFGGGMTAARMLPHSPNVASASAPPSTAIQDYDRAQTLRLAGHCDRAIPLYLSAIAKYATYVNAHVGLGYCYQTVGSYAAAIAEYDKAIRIDPTNYALYMVRAGAEAIAGRTGAAVSDDTVALRLAPPQAPIYLSIAESFASFADFAGAITAATKAIALEPNNPALYEQRASFYMQMQDVTHAIADYQRAIRVAPSAAARAAIYANLAAVYDQQADYESAFRAIAAAIRLQPDAARFYIQAGAIHQDAGDYAAALSLYDRALHFAHNWRDAEIAHEGKGDVRMKLQQPRQALAEYRQALTITGTNDAAARMRLESKIENADLMISGQRRRHR